MVSLCAQMHCSQIDFDANELVFLRLDVSGWLTDVWLELAEELSLSVSG